MTTPAAKPFPWKCGYCRQRAVQPATVAYSTEVDHDGATYTVTLPQLQVARCAHCGEMVLDDAANRHISDALRRQLGFLFPEQIRSNRETLGLSRHQLAGRLGVTEASVARWEIGAQIQSRAVDRLLRVFFAFNDVRDALAEETTLGRLGVLDGTGRVA